MPLPLIVDRSRAGAAVHVYDADDVPWRAAGKPGIALKAVREDTVAGQFLGMVAFEPMTRSGLHQHQGVASSFFVDGSLTDYAGTAGLHEVGINLAGATHDAIAYQRALMVSRLEAPVTYPRESGALHGLHSGAFHADIVNPAPDVPPDINVAVDRLPPVALALPGVRRQTIFDYAGTGSAHRMVQLALRPSTVLPVFAVDGLVELWIRGGAIDVNGRVAGANCFVILEPGATVRIGSRFGALLLAWAESPARWVDAPPEDAAGLFGF